ncbi:hypothetical protein RN001_003729 [Aquatica leii]|uniref:Uncharacterized protein n=1 Tax=Aquatica leii TaxID=1421715 RepID=A0AAN7SRP6_9COLE|nr:hypothetical protein RN001_003729 [Aquatica leii]
MNAYTRCIKCDNVYYHKSCAQISSGCKQIEILSDCELICDQHVTKNENLQEYVSNIDNISFDQINTELRLENNVLVNEIRCLKDEIFNLKTEINALRHEYELDENFMLQPVVSVEEETITSTPVATSSKVTFKKIFKSLEVQLLKRSYSFG